MNRFVELPISVEETKIDWQRVLTIDLQDTPLEEWCLNLCLLREGLIDTLTCSSNRRLRIVTDKASASRRARIDSQPNYVNVRLHPEELHYWVSFFLKAYRDGMAEVDHIDVEASNLDESEEFYLTVKVKNAAPPLSAEEARRILDSYD